MANGQTLHVYIYTFTPLLSLLQYPLLDKYELSNRTSVLLKKLETLNF